MFVDCSVFLFVKVNTRDFLSLEEKVELLVLFLVLSLLIVDLGRALSAITKSITLSSHGSKL